MPANGAQIRAARALLGWSQRDLARAATVHVNSIRYWERHHWLSLRLIESPTTGAKQIVAALQGVGVRLTYDPVGVSLDPVQHGKPLRSVLRRRASERRR